jgi:hypothetical protein
MTTDTTNEVACPYCRAKPYSDDDGYSCGTEVIPEWGVSRSGFCYQNQILQFTNEVARLRELLNRAIEIADEFWKNQKQAVTVWHCELADELKEIKSKARLDPSPEEPANPTCANTTHEFSHCDCKEPDSEWRELGDDDTICEGDEKFVGRGPWLTQAMYIGEKAGKYPLIRFRTRRPLPKQERIPPRLDAEIEIVEYPSIYSHVEARYATADAIRYLRDEIQKLKEAKP